MKITDIITGKKPCLSFEVFPPKTSDKFESVSSATKAIAALKPGFMSVTYGAGGGTFGTAELYNGDLYYHAYSPQQFWSAVRQCGCAYVFVQYSDDVFEQSYAALFSDGLAAAANGSPALYRVDEQQGLFVPVAMTEGAA